jgi:acetyltransferase-like isoleucine patch superfamily enzyme
LTQEPNKMARIDYDWYPGDIPDNVILGESVYIDSAYGFAGFHSQLQPALTLGKASGTYDRASFIAGREGFISIGDYTVLNGCYLICEKRVSIGNHCLLAWGSVVTDSWAGARVPLAIRRQLVERVSTDPDRRLQPGAPPQSVVIEDNVWVGFDSVILPGVRLGRGCIIGCKVVIDSDVPPYAVVVGSPARILRYLDPDDDESARQRALHDYTGRGDNNNRKPVYGK